MRLLLLSNSRCFGMGYLEHAGEMIRDYLGEGVKTVTFVPYAGVTIDWDSYTEMVAARFGEIGYRMTSVHAAADPVAAIEGAEAIAVGGGNTFHLLKTMTESGVLGAIQARVRDGVPYMGWSAGSNVACPTICTTNDMPVVEPPSFNALGLIGFQLNPHYTEEVLPNHQGETRGDRIAEFVKANPGQPVVGLREGSTLRVEGKEIVLLGDKPLKLFGTGDTPRELAPGESLAFLSGT